jgi:hypothetical protein
MTTLHYYRQALLFNDSGDEADSVKKSGKKQPNNRGKITEMQGASSSAHEKARALRAERFEREKSRHLAVSNCLHYNTITKLETDCYSSAV